MLEDISGKVSTKGYYVTWELGEKERKGKRKTN